MGWIEAESRFVYPKVHTLLLTILSHEGGTWKLRSCCQNYVPEPSGTVFRHGFNHRMHVQFLVDTLNVGTYRFDADSQFGGHQFVA